MSKTGGRLIQGESFVLGAIGSGLPALLLACGVGWLGTQGYPWAWLAALSLVGLGLRGMYLAVRGGVMITDASVEVRGWFTRKRIARDGARSLLVRRDRAGEPSGWLVTGSGEMKLRGATARHRHGLGGSTRCSVCEADHRNLTRIAEDLGVPVVEETSLDRT